jgi:ubiquinone/menaquinone biosynthesis C-methylase UbiE
LSPLGCGSRHRTVMRVLTKDWDRHVVAAEDVARGRGFQHLKSEIVRRAGTRRDDRVVDVGAGTGLLSLALAERVAHVYALDISPAMVEYLGSKARSADLTNVDAIVASAISLPLVDHSVDLFVSNYCFHHLRHRDKTRALSEASRVLKPGGRLVVGDMMFGVGLTSSRDRRVVASKARSMLRKGPAGVARLIKNAARIVTGSWERPARPEWWEQALAGAGFDEVAVEVLPHEGGIATARKPS